METTIPITEQELAVFTFLSERTDLREVLIRNPNMPGVKVWFGDEPPYCIRRCAIEAWLEKCNPTPPSAGS